MTIPAPRDPHHDCYCPACRKDRLRERAAERTSR